MPKKKSKIDEEAIRRRIRRELEEKHQQKQDTRSSEPKDEVQTSEQINIKVLERFIREKVEQELFSAHPEFIRCENHLGEVRWFTVFELENEYEFYPIEESRIKKVFSRLFPARAPKIIDKKQAEELERRLRREMQEDIERRLQVFNKQREEAEQHHSRELESKIYREEMERFYRSQPGYKKYRNHLGEERWMTAEEFQNQEEFYEEVLTPKQKFLRYGLLAFSLLLIGTLGWLLYVSQMEEEIAKGYITVDVNKEQVHLYLDQRLVVGFEPNKIYPIEVGRHIITVLSSEYRSIPPADTVQIEEGDTTYLAFRLVPRELDETGLVTIRTNTGNALIFVDGDFYGDLKAVGKFNLSPGPHTVIVRKEQYISEPPQHTIHVQKGDTIQLAFKLTPAREVKKQNDFNPLTDIGFIEVKTNIKGARIFLDGQTTSFKSDYVLQRIPYGKHIIRVEKEGYKVYPEERVVFINKKQKKGKAEFTLTALFRAIQIRTRPVAGAIYLDGKQVGMGEFKGSVPLGEHTVDFSKVPFYKKPSKQKLIISSDGTSDFTFHYRNLFTIIFTPQGIKPNSDFGSIVTGYVLERSGFQTSNQTGPDVVMNNNIGQKVWKLGLAFDYRNPPGSDALLFVFNIPDRVDLSEAVYLKIWGYDTDDNYPLVVKGETSYRILINNYRYRNAVKPTYKIAQIGPSHYDRFEISSLLKHGRNVILIATTEDASAHLALWKISIE